MIIVSNADGRCHKNGDTDERRPTPTQSIDWEGRRSVNFKRRILFDQGSGITRHRNFNWIRSGGPGDQFEQIAWFPHHGLNALNATQGCAHRLASRDKTRREIFFIHTSQFIAFQADLEHSESRTSAGKSCTTRREDRRTPLFKAQSYSIDPSW